MSQIQKQESSAVIDTIALRVNQFGRELYVFTLDASKVHDLIVSNKMDTSGTQLKADTRNSGNTSLQ